jgi:hypothetical protein
MELYDMGRIVRLSIGISIIFLFSACSGTSIATGTEGARSLPSAIETLVSTSELSGIPSPTVTPAATFTQTQLPTLTPTPTQIPDIELRDTVLTTTGYRTTLIGRIRNNTNRLVYFGGDETGLVISYETWYMDDFQEYIHAFAGPIKLRNSRGDTPYLPCFLFPGETGIFAVSLDCREEEGCRSNSIPSVNPPQSLRPAFTSTSLNIPYPYPKLPGKDAHLSLNSGQFLAEGDLLFFKFPFTGAPGEGRRIRSFLVLLDKDNKILNILTDYSWASGGNTEITGWTAVTSPADLRFSYQVVGNYWNAGLPLDYEAINGVDHIEVFLEFDYYSDCR